jgi:site-specific recombinase XerD
MLLGHKDIATTAKYITSSEKEQKNAILELIANLNYEKVFSDFDS